MSKTRAAPRSFRPGARYIDWDGIVAHARAHPGSWLLVLPAVQHRLVGIVNRAERRELRDLRGGRLSAEGRNLHLGEDGRRKVDLFVRWTTYEEGR